MPLTRTTLLLILFVPSAIADDKKEEPKLDNNLISDFVDNPEKYKGKTLTLKVTFFSSNPATTIRDRVGDNSVPFDAKDPKNGAKLGLGLDIPKELKVPAAKTGEAVIVTFKCTAGKTDKGNVAVSIVRP